MLVIAICLCLLKIQSRAPIGQGYGLTETCGGATFSEFDDTSVGRAGSPLPCSYIKVRSIFLGIHIPSLAQR